MVPRVPRVAGGADADADRRGVDRRDGRRGAGGADRADRGRQPLRRLWPAHRTRLGRFAPAQARSPGICPQGGQCQHQRRHDRGRPLAHRRRAANPQAADRDHRTGRQRRAARVRPGAGEGQPGLHGRVRAKGRRESAAAGDATAAQLRGRNTSRSLPRCSATWPARARPRWCRSCSRASATSRSCSRPTASIRPRRRSR